MACGFVHEEAHRKFFQAHDMLGHDKDIDKFHTSHYFELEENAILEEIDFLQNAKKVVSQVIDSRSFIVKSWRSSGFPICEVTKISVCPPIRLDFLLSRRQNVLQEMKLLQSHNTATDGCRKMSRGYDSNAYSILSVALKLSEPLPASPIFELPIL